MQQRLLIIIIMLLSISFVAPAQTTCRVNCPDGTSHLVDCNTNTDPCGSSNNRKDDVYRAPREPSKRQQRKSRAYDLNDQGIAANEKARKCWDSHDWDCAINYFNEAINLYGQANDVDADKIYRGNRARNEALLAEVTRNKKFYYAKTFLDRKQYTDALNAYKDYISKYPDEAAAHYNLCVAYWGLGMYEEAYNECKWSLRLYPDFASAKMQIDKITHLYADKLNEDGVKLSDESKFSEAEVFFAKAVALDPSNRQFIENLGEMQTNQDHFKDAENTYTKLLKLFPNDGSVHIRMGLAMFGQKRLTEAESYYRKATVLTPENPDAYMSLAIVLGEQKNDEAEIHYKKAIELLPDKVWYHNYYAGFLEKMGRDQDAAVEYERSLKLKNHDNYAHARMIDLISTGKINANAGNILSVELKTDNAINTAYKNSSLEVMDRVRKGFQALKIDDWDVAKAWFEDALRREPNNAGIKNFLTLCDYSHSLNVKAKASPNDKIEYKELNDVEKNILNVWIHRLREDVRNGNQSIDVTSDLPASAMEKVRKYIYGLSDSERDKLVFPDDFMADYILYDLTK
jgi:tetratricopeptide (TPR) repeat protein